MQDNSCVYTHVDLKLVGARVVSTGGLFKVLDEVHAVSVPMHRSVENTKLAFGSRISAYNTRALNFQAHVHQSILLKEGEEQEEQQEQEDLETIMAC